MLLGFRAQDAVISWVGWARFCVVLKIEFFTSELLGCFIGLSVKACQLEKF